MSALSEGDRRSRSMAFAWNLAQQPAQVSINDIIAEVGICVSDFAN